MTRAIAAALALCCLVLMGNRCVGGGAAGGPLVSVTLNGIDDDLNDLLVIPTDADLYVTATFAAAGSPVSPTSFGVLAATWADRTVVGPDWIAVHADRGAARLPAGSLAAGTHVVLAWVRDESGAVGFDWLRFAVRDRPAGPPIGTGQELWYDFEADRDGIPGADFALDLETFGLASPTHPELSTRVRADVIEAILDRVAEVYHEAPHPAGAGWDPVEVAFHSEDPGTGDVTRICVGGEDPSGANTLGRILIDPANGVRNSVECGTIPPTGIFPRELLVYRHQAAFRDGFDPLMPEVGGIRVGEHPLDAGVLAEGFDPGAASAAELARWADIDTALERFADALGSVVAHETGHALGLVAPGAPGPGLHGGASGLEFSHDVEADGVTSPPENYLLKHGGTFDFASLAGLAGHPLPFLRPLDHAYLRDRVMTDPKVTELLPPPSLAAVAPSHLEGTTRVTVTGSNFAPTPSLRLENDSFVYYFSGESYRSVTELTAFVVALQVPSGTYDLVIQNPDGQEAVLPDAVTVGP